MKTKTIHAVIVPFLLLVFLKPIATSFTLGSGNSGGVFAPSLFTGAMLGGSLGVLFSTLLPELSGPVGAYALVGMAAVFADEGKVIASVCHGPAALLDIKLNDDMMTE